MRQKYSQMNIKVKETPNGHRASTEIEGVVVSAESDTEVGAMIALLAKVHPDYEIKVSPFALMAGTGEGLTGQLNKKTQ